MNPPLDSDLLRTFLAVATHAIGRERPDQAA